jgi:hypothetical protein
VYSSIPNSCNKAKIMPAIWDNALPWLEQWYKKDLSYLKVGKYRMRLRRGFLKARILLVILKQQADIRPCTHTHTHTHACFLVQPAMNRIKR